MTTTDTSTQTATAGQPANPAAPQPGASATPAQAPTQTVTPEEHQRLLRIENQFRGASPMIDRAVKLGFKTPEDLDRAHATAQRIASLGLDIDQLEKAMQGHVEDAGSEGPNADDLIKQVMGKVDERFAHREHESAMQQETRLTQGLVTKLAGDSADKHAKLVISGLVTQLMLDRSELYPEGHALAGQLKPVSETVFKEVQAEAEAAWTAIRGPASLARIANAAHTATAPAPGGQGPSGETTNPKPNRPAYMQPREVRLARARELRASRVG